MNTPLGCCLGLFHLLSGVTWFSYLDRSIKIDISTVTKYFDACIILQTASEHAFLLCPLMKIQAYPGL